MHSFDSDLTDLIFSYMRERLAMPEVPLDNPGDADDVQVALQGLLRAQGNSPAEVMKIYDEVISRTVISADSPRFLAFIPAAPTKAALLFDMVVSCASLQAISWLEAAGAVAAENQVLRWMSDLAGLPESAGGTFVSGGSAANLAALTVARDIGRRALGGKVPVRIAVSDQVHSSNRNSLSILDIEPLVVPCADHRMTGADLQRALDQDTSGIPVVGVVATAGTTNAGIVDDLEGIGAIAQARGMWFHVDAAYGGAALLAPSVRERFRGVEHADSITMDPHKWWFSPFDVAAIIYRNPQLAKSVHEQKASYLEVLHEHGDNDWNPTDYAYHLTRRARGLPLWFSVSVNGTDAYRDAVEHSLALTREVANYIRESEELELVLEPTLSVVLWRRKGWTSKDYERMQNVLIEQQIGFVTPSLWLGESVGRFAFIHPHTTLDMVKEILDVVVNLG
ncbi:MAG: aminotransferase class I/II-fold pyridoxal phosphate-dependent enzyme [Actinomycetes bacterium]